MKYRSVHDKSIPPIKYDGYYNFTPLEIYNCLAYDFGHALDDFTPLKRKDLLNKEIGNYYDGKESIVKEVEEAYGYDVFIFSDFGDSNRFIWYLIDDTDEYMFDKKLVPQLDSKDSFHVYRFYKACFDMTNNLSYKYVSYGLAYCERLNHRDNYNQYDVRTILLKDMEYYSYIGKRLHQFHDFDDTYMDDSIYSTYHSLYMLYFFVNPYYMAGAVVRSVKHIYMNGGDFNNDHQSFVARLPIITINKRMPVFDIVHRTYNHNFYNVFTFFLKSKFLDEHQIRTKFVYDQEILLRDFKYYNYFNKEVENSYLYKFRFSRYEDYILEYSYMLNLDLIPEKYGEYDYIHLKYGRYDNGYQYRSLYHILFSKHFYGFLYSKIFQLANYPVEQNEVFCESEVFNNQFFYTFLIY